MSFKILLPLLGLCFIGLAWMHRGYWIVAGWFGYNLLALGMSHMASFHGLFGKRPDGTLPLLTWVAFFPLMVVTMITWKLSVLLSRESPHNIVNDTLVVGRRLIANEPLERCEQYLDLTAEFPEPRSIRTLDGYRSFPILDAGAPKPQALLAMVQSLGRKKTYVHCAAGHGRTGLVALAILLQRGDVTDIEQGIALLQKVRPGIHLNKVQRTCIDEFSRMLT